MAKRIRQGNDIMKLVQVAAAAAFALAALGAAHSASAQEQTHFFVFNNASTETLTHPLPTVSGAGGFWSPAPPTTPAAAGATISGDWMTNDLATINFSDTWTASDGSFCTFAIFSQKNSFGNIQFFESTSSGGPRTPVCTITAPAQPFSTIHGNAEMDYNMHF
jgi:hypothetical protein